MSSVDHITSILDELNPELAWKYLLQLVDGVHVDAPACRFDLETMVANMIRYTHAVDDYHSGETILQHTSNVLEDILELSSILDHRSRRVLALVALLHDTGKAFAHTIAYGRPVYHGHVEASVEIAERLLFCLRGAHEEEYRRVVETIRLHDASIVLVEGRKESRGSRKYLNWLRREWLYTSGHLDDLLVFTMADSRRAKVAGIIRLNLDEVLRDLYEVEQAERAEQELVERRRKPSEELLGRVRPILEAAHVPELIEKLPDVRAVKRELGRAKRYDLLRLIEEAETWRP